MKRVDKCWNFIKNQAAGSDQKGVELRIEGDIIDDRDEWLYDWYGEPSASPIAFRSELANCKGQDLTVWINSPGGSVFAAAGIYTALMEHKNTGASVTVKIDGWVASAATVIAMAGDPVLMSPLAMMMMHESLMPSVVSGVGYADDHDKTASVLREINETIINAYESKTEKSREEIAAFMKDETYMSAQRAVDEGFADGILYTENKTPKAANFSFSHAAIVNASAISMDRLLEIAKACQSNQSINPEAPEDGIKNHEEEKKEMEIKNEEDLKAQLPEIHTAVFNAGNAAGNAAGITAERTRLKAFDMLNGKVDAEYLDKAKYEDGATAESVLFKAMQEGKTINAAYVANAETDAKNANKVPGSASDETTPNEVTGVLNRVAAIAKKTLGITEGGNK